MAITARTTIASVEDIGGDAKLYGFVFYLTTPGGEKHIQCIIASYPESGPRPTLDPYYIKYGRAMHLMQTRDDTIGLPDTIRNDILCGALVDSVIQGSNLRFEIPDVCSWVKTHLDESLWTYATLTICNLVTGGQYVSANSDPT